MASRKVVRDAPMTIVIDGTSLVNGVAVVDRMGHAITNTKDGKSIAKIFIHQLQELFSESMHASAREKIKDIAHVYMWRSISETQSKYTVSPRKDRPLFNLVIKGDDILIIPLAGPSKVQQDKRIARLLPNATIAQHHFKDQAGELESVNKIVKTSSRVSRRRISGNTPRLRNAISGDDGSKEVTNRRILVLSDNGKSVMSVYSHIRDNPFYQKFQHFFKWYFSSESLDEETKFLGKLFATTAEKDFSLIAKSYVDYRTKGSMGAMRSFASVSSFGSQFTIGFKGRPRTILLVDGKIEMRPGSTIEKVTKKAAGKIDKQLEKKFLDSMKKGTKKRKNKLKNKNNANSTQTYKTSGKTSPKIDTSVVVTRPGEEPKRYDKRGRRELPMRGE